MPQRDSQHCAPIGIVLFVIVSASSFVSASCPPTVNSYDRREWRFESFEAPTKVGFYTMKRCESIDIDHLVSLKDAHLSGANSWTNERKQDFANDKENLVPACANVNRSKGSATPSTFLKRSRDGKGLDYQIVNFCSYLAKYYSMKIKYNLSFCNNDKPTFAACGITID